MMFFSVLMNYSSGNKAWEINYFQGHCMYKQLRLKGLLPLCCALPTLLRGFNTGFKIFCWSFSVRPKCS